MPACVGMTGCRGVKYVRVPCVRASVRPCAHISRVHATVRPVLPSIRTTCPSIPRLHIERTSPLHRPHEAHRRSVHRPPHRRRPLRMARNTNNRRTHADRGSGSEPAAKAAEEPAYAPNARSSAYMRHPTKRCSKLPATSPHARNSYPSYRRTSQHIVRSIAQSKGQNIPHSYTQQEIPAAPLLHRRPPAPHRRTPRHIAHSTAQPKQQPTHTATRNKASSTHCPRKKRPVPAPTNAASSPPSSAPTQRKAATAPSPGPGKPQGAPAAVPPDRRGRKRSAPRRSRQAPSRTTSRHKRKSARTERSVCADLHRVQGYPCGDITSSCRRWSSWRPSEPKPSLRQPSGPSERQPSWVRPF